MLRPTHFLILASNTDRAIKFYSEIFGWLIEKEGDMDYWSVKTGSDPEGIDGGLLKHTEAPAKGGANAFIITISVPNFDDFDEKILKAGGKNITAKHEIPGYGWHGDYYDTEGNMFSIMEPMRGM